MPVKFGIQPNPTKYHVIIIITQVNIDLIEICALSAIIDLMDVCFAYQCMKGFYLYDGKSYK